MGSAVTTNARKQAARDHQRSHHVSYTEALRAVTQTSGDLTDRPWPITAARIDPLGVDQRFQDALNIPDVATFDPQPGWQRRSGDRVLRIPVGAPPDASHLPTTIEIGEHASILACVGTGGAGKSVALQSIVAGLCAIYPPTRVIVAVGDYQNCIGSAGSLPPHVKAHRGHHRPEDPPGHWESWCAYLDDEIDRRATQTRHDPPELVVVIDAVDELLDWQPEVTTTLQRVIDQGPRLGVRLIVSSTRPPALLPTGDGRTVSLTCDCVLALRTATAQDSVDVLGSPDAWHLSEDPGYAYLRSHTGTPDGPIRLFNATEVAYALGQRLGAG
ncbi:MAG: hypothetical protein K2X52_28010 [Mycobacteriaceae bacterium]|nr:hypothetical protein [Mycobacteriaceae bacterium]